MSITYRGLDVKDRVHPDSAEEIIHRVSHDLRGPLLNFQGFLRRLRQGGELLRTQAESWNLAPEQRRVWDEIWDQKVSGSLQILDQNAERMGRLLTALLALSRAGREPLHPTWFSARDRIQALAEEFRTTLLKKKATLTLGFMPEVWADPPRFEEIFRQLLANAIAFLAPGRPGTIAVEGKINGEEAICWIRDNGIGIQAKDLERIFLPLERVREIDAPGEGIGLAVAHKLVEQHGGRIWVESVHHQESTVFVALPVP